VALASHGLGLNPLTGLPQSGLSWVPGLGHELSVATVSNPALQLNPSRSPIAASAATTQDAEHSASAATQRVYAGGIVAQWLDLPVAN